MASQNLGWYVPCGCDSHGDHAACGKSCAVWGCSHPLGVEVTAPTEALADEWAGGEAPKRVIHGAILEAMEASRRKYERAGRKHQKRMNRLTRLAEEYSS